MLLPITAVARDVDSTDLSDLTTAMRTGPAVWSNGGLEIPFDRELTQSEVDAIALRLTTSDSAEEADHQKLVDYLAKTSPTAAEQRAHLKIVTRLLLRVLDAQTSGG